MQWRASVQLVRERASGLVARTAQQCAVQRNGRHLERGTEPGLQADWHFSPHNCAGTRAFALPFHQSLPSGSAGRVVCAKVSAFPVFRLAMRVARAPRDRSSTGRSGEVFHSRGRSPAACRDLPKLRSPPAISYLAGFASRSFAMLHARSHPPLLDRPASNEKLPCEEWIEFSLVASPSD